MKFTVNILLTAFNVFILLRMNLELKAFENPTATNRENPILGTYRILSATTNPTGKNKFDAGTNGNTIRESP